MHANGSSWQVAYQLYFSSKPITFIFCLRIISQYSAILKPVIEVLQSVQVEFPVQMHVQKLFSVVKTHRETPQVTICSKVNKSLEYKQYIISKGIFNSRHYDHVLGLDQHLRNLETNMMSNDIKACKMFVFRQYLGDNDSSSFSNVVKNKSYGDYIIEKLWLLLAVLAIIRNRKTTISFFNNLVWQRCPKATITKRKIIEISVYSSILNYNHGFSSSSCSFKTIGFPGAPFVWTDTHDDLMIREILVIEPYKYKRGSTKRGDAWTKISDILNSIESPKFRVNQRAVIDRFNLLEKSFKKKMSDEEKLSGISPPDLTDTEIGIQEIIDKANIFDNDDAAKNNIEKVQAEEIRRRCLETFAEIKSRNNDGNDTISFLMQQSKTNSDLKKEELKIKVSALEPQREQMENKSLLMAQQQSIYSSMMEQLHEQNVIQQQNQQQLMVSLMQSQQQQTQLFSALIEKLNN
ncbi:uncharacterized protein LOC136078489 [Hydra vulgaris]|uniref:Uncharacterized protein LOC136078489 n=1 Tax=Hydra vulgaris TaxID=6087 RepID=A0ABM4BMM5_HYDVU